MTKEADCGGWRADYRYVQTHSAMWLLFEQGCVQVTAGAPFAVGAGGCCGLVCGQDPAMSDARPHRRLRLPRLRLWSRPCDSWAVSQEKGADFAMGPGFLCGFRRGRSLSASPTWGNAGVLWRFGQVRPAKPPRSCERDSLASEMAHLNVCFSLVGAGRHPRMNKAFEARWRPEVSKIEINTHIKLTSVSRYYKVTAG